MARFRDIARAEELIKAKAAHDNWLKLDAPAKAAAYKASIKNNAKRLRTGKQKGYIKLFDSDKAWVYCNLLSGTNLNMDATAGDSEPTLLTSIINKVIGPALYAVTARPDIATQSVLSAIGLNLQSKLAKVTFKKTSGDLVDRISRFTNRPYKAKNSNAASCAFGSLVTSTTASTGTYGSAVNALRAGLLPSASSEGLSVRFQPQGNINIA